MLQDPFVGLAWVVNYVTPKEDLMTSYNNKRYLYYFIFDTALMLLFFTRLHFKCVKAFMTFLMHLNANWVFFCVVQFNTISF